MRKKKLRKLIRRTLAGKPIPVHHGITIFGELAVALWNNCEDEADRKILGTYIAEEGTKMAAHAFGRKDSGAVTIMLDDPLVELLTAINMTADANDVEATVVIEGLIAKLGVAEAAPN